MREAIAWSYDLLDDDARTLLRRCSVFVGGYTLEAAEAVSDLSGDGRAIDVLTVLLSLVDNSLVRQATGVGDAARFVMLETIREFALERLEDAGELESVRDAHARSFEAFAERGHPNALRPGERIDDRLARVEMEHPNLRAALAYRRHTGDAVGVLRLAGNLIVFWFLRGHIREAHHWLEWALSHTDEAATVWRCRALHGFGLMLWSESRFEEARPYAEAALAIARRIGDKEQMAESVHLLGMLAFAQERNEEASALTKKALALWLEVGTQANVAMAYLNQGWIARGLGDLESALTHGDRALGILRSLGHASGTAAVLKLSAVLAQEQGHDVRMAAVCHESLRVWSNVDGPWSLVRDRTVADDARVDELGVPVFPLFVGLDDPRALVGPLVGLARIAAMHGQPEVGATLVGAVDRLEGELSPSSSSFDRGNYERAATVARATLGDARFEALRAAGTTLPLSEVVGLALAVEGHPPGSRRLDSRDPEGLTRRESEVLRLLAKGHTDREIAGLLFISRHTAAHHVASILAKLGLPSRAAAAAFAVRHGLD